MSSVSNAEQVQEQTESDSVATLLFVDDEANILKSLKRMFRPQGYNIVTALNGCEGIEVMEQQPVDLIISDMRMPEMDGAEFLSHVAERWPDTVRILLTGYADLDSTIKAVNDGQIYRYISKPWEENDVTLCVKRALEQKNLEAERLRLEVLSKKQNAELKQLNSSLEDKVRARTSELEQTVSFLELAQQTLNDSYQATVEVFSNLIGMRERRTGYARQVADQVVKLGRTFCLDETELRNLRFAALLRNIGKIGLEDNILNKPLGSMNSTEKKIFSRHPVIGEGVLMALEPLHGAARLIRQQHEQMNGKGYPDQLKDDDIPLPASILKVVGDYYDLQHGLLLPSSIEPSEAYDYLRKHRDSRYSTRVVDKFCKVVGRREKPVKKVSDRCFNSRGLKIGMVLSRDLVLSDKVLLLSRGSILNDGLIKRIHHLDDSFGGGMEIYIINRGGG